MPQSDRSVESVPSPSSCIALQSHAVISAPHGRGQFELQERPVQGETFPELRQFGIPWAQRQFRVDQPPLRQLGSFDLTERVARAFWTLNQGAPEHDWIVSEVPSSDSQRLRRVFIVQNRRSCVGGIVVQERKPVSSALTFATKLRADTGDDIRRLIQRSLILGGNDYRVRLVGSHVVSHPLIRRSCTAPDDNTVSDNCELYILPFHVMNDDGDHVDPLAAKEGELFIVEAEWMYSDWDGLDEQRTDTTPMRREPLLEAVSEKKSKFGVIEGAQHHSPQLNLYTFHHPEEGKWIRKSKFRSSKQFIWDQFTFHSGPLLSCRSDLSVNSTSAPHRRSTSDETNCFSVQNVASHRSRTLTIGEWVRSGYDDRYPRNMTEAEMKAERNHHVHFERTNPQALYAFRISEALCPSGLSGFGTAGSFVTSLQRRFKKLERIRIHFVGDSHIRVAAVHLRNFLASDVGCRLEDHGVKSMGERLYRFAFSSLSVTTNLDVHYANDVLLEKFVGRRSGEEWFDVCKVAADFCTPEHDSTILVLGMGSWAIGGKGPDLQQAANGPPDYGHWSLGKFQRVMEQIAKRIRSFLMEHPLAVVVWLAIPAYPPNTRRYAKLRGEHRTNPRIFVMNSISLNVLSKEFAKDEFASRLRIVDSFDVTYPVMHLSLDHNHFTTYPQDAILHLLLNSVQ
jgi:hypothetical protein